MEDENDLKKLYRAIDMLQTDIQRLAVPYEDALSNRVFDGTKKKLFIQFGTWASIITGLLALFGFNAYDKIVSGATEIVIKNFSEKVTPELQKRAEETLQREVSVIIKNYSLDVQTKVDSQLSQVIKTVQNQSDVKLNQALKEIGVKLNDGQFAQQTSQSIRDTVKKEQTLLADGWSFYGALSPDGQWRARYFELNENGGKNTASTPSINDTIKAITDINLRSDAPTYSDSDGWSYPPIQAVINYGQIVTVQNVKRITNPKGEYFWVQISRQL